MGWRDAARELGLPEHAVYSCIKSGTLPAWRIGTPGKRGRFIVDLELCEQAIRDKMMENIKPEVPAVAYGTIRQVK